MSQKQVVFTSLKILTECICHGRNKQTNKDIIGRFHLRDLMSVLNPPSVVKVEGLPERIWQQATSNETNQNL